MNNITVLQFATKEWVELTKLSQIINKAYCNYNNYNYIYHEVDLPNNLGIIFLEKLKQVKKCLETSTSEYIVYIDIDAVFANPLKRIESLLDDSHYFFMSRDGAIFTYKERINQLYYVLSQMITPDNKLIDIKNISNYVLNKYNINLFTTLGLLYNNPYGLNAGFYILKNTDLSKQLLNDCITYYKVFDKDFYDQNCISYFLQRDEYYKYMKVLDFNTQGHGHPCDPNQNMVFNKDKHFIAHCAGTTYNFKIYFLTNIKNTIYKNLIKE